METLFGNTASRYLRYVGPQPPSTERAISNSYQSAVFGLGGAVGAQGDITNHV